ncbi:MAG: ATP-binding protein [Clostridiales bacterium]|nr:ATP-binding protein [Clostridiales bacterium]MDD6389205.1 ATP-binding protein [Bacillota bacterium]
MTRKIFNSITLVAAAVLLISSCVLMACLYEYFGSIREDALRDEMKLAIRGVQTEGTDYLENVKADGYRLTWIDKDGSVIYDTVRDNQIKENHLQREEVQEALNTGTGESRRFSDTLLEKTIYYAKKMDDGTVLRISVSAATAGLLAIGMIPPVLFILIIALVLSGILASRLSKRIVKPINSIDLENPLDNDTYEEISPLLNRINRQKILIDIQVDELQQKKDEFNKITSCMKEGLILVNEQIEVVSINPSAMKLFDVEEDCTGNDFLTIYRDHEMNLALKNAFEEGHSEISRGMNGHEYQFDISRIDSGGKIIGAVILIFDVTEKTHAEKVRREFTANVSHELKTPLQGIIGSAELIENGMVKHNDMPKFIGMIHKEASRLVTLVDDIIRLSQLDEKGAMPEETVSLRTIADEVSESLLNIAERRNISITVTGDEARITCVPKLIYEVVYNLCENAVKYNVDGGSVAIDIKDSGKSVQLKVTDTGIGISREHLERVFERFYRVDKSHSKETGGTGLGLSIVKHAVSYHHGSVSVKSEEGKGTEFTVVLPVK